MENLNKNKFDALTGMRAVAAIMVFVYHNRKYWRHDLPFVILRFISEWHIGVTVFFVLSGFLLAYRYEESPLDSKKSYLKYILLRIARIFPLYWILLSFYFLDTAYSKNVDTYFLQYSLFYSLFDKYSISGIVQAWSLTVEFFFYLFSPFLFLLLKKNWKYCVSFLLGLFLLSWGIGYGFYWYNGNPDGFLYPLKFMVGNTFFGRSLEFFFGMLLAYLMKQEKGMQFLKSLKKPTLFGGISMIALIISIAFFAKHSFSHGVERWEGRVIHEFFLPVAIAVFFWGLMSEKTWVSKILSTKIFVLLGNASFVFYLIHLSYFNMKLKSYIYLPDRNFVLLWICSIIIYLLIEKPLYKWCRNLIAKIR
ncbi:peptidoglycan/LPS O-acetylase OafA/YrhL [Chryseobacterium ginsenosidimutans]|uniref:acyltransferase family protein n=1 Tax=Chryseobacterium ginsenosidimutans TaxID=687846 RepID=UPI0021694708|nr:acyltransferase [Chryseobacterium ginsenosidimutans]MCS3871374.1 peptidoglycan/LPS O-acetylase OafA/YrhL [Chryseobacterium ginsenosidimutans]